MQQDLDINYFIKTLVENIRTILAIIVLSVLLSIAYALTATKYYKAYIHILPPQDKYIQALNIVDANGDLIGNRTLPYIPTDIYTAFVRNVQSRKFQREYFFNEVSHLFDEADRDKSFEDNFHNALYYTLSAKTTSRDIRYQSFLTITYIHTNPQQAATILNKYIDMVDKKTSQQFTDGVNQLIDNAKVGLMAEIQARRLLAEQVTQDRIRRLEEAYTIADKLGIESRVNDIANSQNVILSQDNQVASDTPLYLYGTKSLRAEIDVLSNRESYDAFIPGLRELEQKAEGYKKISLSPNDVRAIQIDQPAYPPNVRFSPKRKVIVLMGGLLGGFTSFLYLLYLMIVRRSVSR